MVCLFLEKVKSGGARKGRTSEQFNLYYGFSQDQIEGITFSGVLCIQREIKFKGPHMDTVPVK